MSTDTHLAINRNTKLTWSVGAHFVGVIAGHSVDLERTARHRDALVGDIQLLGACTPPASTSSTSASTPPASASTSQLLRCQHQVHTTHTRTHTNACMHAHTHTHTHTHTSCRRKKHMPYRKTHTYTHARTHTHTHAKKSMQKHTHTHTHSHTHMQPVTYPVPWACRAQGRFRPSCCWPGSASCGQWVWSAPPAPPLHRWESLSAHLLWTL